MVQFVSFVHTEAATFERAHAHYCGYVERN